MFIGYMLCSKHWEYKYERESSCPSKAGSDGNRGITHSHQYKEVFWEDTEDISASSGEKEYHMRKKV